MIKNADMSEDMQQDAVECATQAMEKFNIEKDIAAYIKKEVSDSLGACFQVGFQANDIIWKEQILFRYFMVDARNIWKIIFRNYFIVNDILQTFNLHTQLFDYSRGIIVVDKK